jgi:phosphosulfolactate phosphohydrolase-like enzyme
MAPPLLSPLNVELNQTTQELVQRRASEQAIAATRRKPYQGLNVLWFDLKISPLTLKSEKILGGI